MARDATLPFRIGGSLAVALAATHVAYNFAGGIAGDLMMFLLWLLLTVVGGILALVGLVKASRPAAWTGLSLAASPLWTTYIPWVSYFVWAALAMFLGGFLGLALDLLLVRQTRKAPA